MALFKKMGTTKTEWIKNNYEFKFIVNDELGIDLLNPAQQI